MAVCLHPIFINGMWVPCQSCPVCRSASRADLSLRIFYEQAYSGYSGYFVTLTYDPEHLPTKSGLPCFNKKHCQDFIRDMRYRLGKLRFFLTCEYGEEKQRSHYHLCLLTEKKYTFDQISGYTDLCWKKGRTQVRHLTLERIQYATSYALKDEEQYLIRWKELGLPECQPFRLFSRNPGLGSLALEQVQELVNSEPGIKHSLLMNGQRYRIPRYFKDRFSEDLKEKYKDRDNPGFYDYQMKLEFSAMTHKKPVTFNEFGICTIFEVNDYYEDRKMLEKRKEIRQQRKILRILPPELK